MEDRKPDEAVDRTPKIFQLEGGKIAVFLPARPASEIIAAAATKRVIICLDRSGSMSGSAYTQACAGVTQLVKDNFAGCLSCTLMLYNKEVMRFEVNSPDFAVTEPARGQTNFVKTFESLRHDVVVPEGEYHIVFFTDGQETCNQPGAVSAAFDQLRDALARVRSCRVHAIGFTADHDTVLLNKLVNVGSVQGTFQYVSSAAEIGPAVGTVSALIGSDTSGQQRFLSGTAVLPSVDLGAEGRLVFVDSLAQAQGLDVEEPQATGGVLRRPLGAMVCPEVPPKLAITVRMEGIVAELSRGVSGEITHAAEARLAPPHHPTRAVPDMALLTRRLLEGDAALEGVQRDIGKLMSLHRKQLMPKWQEVKSFVRELNGLLAEIKAAGLNNDKVAKVNALSSRRSIKQGLQKKLDKRVDANVELFNQIDSRLALRVDQLRADRAALDRYAGTPADPEKGIVGPCIMSCLNWRDAVLDGDALCIGLDIGRSQACIADPSQLTIKAVSATFVSVESFLDSVLYSVERNEHAHGGFVRSEQGSILVGESREPISGALPLFICPEHWSVARDKMKALFGWMCTLDVLGYTYAQVKTIPFLVLAHVSQLLAERPTEWHQRLHGLVLETCMAVYRETPSIKEEVAPLMARYPTDPAARTKDLIPPARSS
ncbi:hypothetical protein PAPYR_6482 [Paratrimastix pyriformis]|uniref:VWFA domain-containing protein n=1 Tax=Paratrimastix pyriformis TaxID=342808 RepID=A0ABQ8UMG1_9EUKA|nr:hypothetical protein PAPYR_6482 [Paratrimastix pyriformis]